MHACILVTGGAGFIGAHFLLNFIKKYPTCTFLNLDALTYASTPSLLNPIDHCANYHFIHGDICDQNLLEQLFDKWHIDMIVHFAAESHVDNSIATPRKFIETNIVGTFNLLHLALKQTHPIRFLHVSTDEVYGSLGPEGTFTESSPYAPNSPYSASKASSDLLVRSFHKTYGLDAVITNCSNNFGPGQHSEKLIPTIIRKALSGEAIPIYGDGSNIRDWLYVKDHCDALWHVLEAGRAGETYNIGTRNERSNLELAHLICAKLDAIAPKGKAASYADQLTFVADRPGHDWRYSLDPSKIESELGWSAQCNFKTALETTIRFYCKERACV